MHHVEPIVPMDDGFHGAKKLSAEWWYFDGIFSKDYSFHIGIRTFSRKKLGRVILYFELYQKEKIIFEKRKKYSFKEFNALKQYPSIKIQNKTILDFNQIRYKNNGEWKYHITCTFDNCSVDLYFTNITEGFKIETNKESWTVALPKAKILGFIEYEDNKLLVDGIGYHDHNWNYTLLSALTYGKGWYWGKIKSKTFNIVWANVIKRSGFQDLLAIVNIDQNGFYNINPENIIFKIKKYVIYKHRRIPSQIYLSFKEIINQIQINVDVIINVEHIHFSKVFFASYWRYHIYVKGSISVNNKIEYVDNMQIMEYLKFI